MFILLILCCLRGKSRKSEKNGCCKVEVVFKCKKVEVTDDVILNVGRAGINLGDTVQKDHLRY